VKDNLQTALAETGGVLCCGRMPTVTVQEVQLIQLFQNLLSNAIKYRHPERKPAIEVTANRQHDSWQISVRDNGIGISPEYQAQIFGLFKRLHDRRQYPGTGIGLAICQKIVERYGGRIWVESQLDQGSTFRFTLPGS
jgi:light-regulated signal transduction histidine kinase (bacteriophytochrome)